VPGSNLTVSQQNAVAAAKQYLQTSAFSKQGLIDQLDSSAGDGYSVNDATMAVDSLTVNWDSEAAQAAKQYLQISAFSCQGMIQQLSSSAGDQYTQAQAQYGATKVGLCSGSSTPTTSAVPGSNLTVSQQNAVAAAKQYLQTSAFSKQGLIDQLDSSAGDGYSVNDATMAVDSLTVNWDSEAAQAAKQYLQISAFSCQGMIQQLSSSAGDQYTQAQAQYGATKVGLC
jgi:short-subunit dehydrogenase